MLAFKASLLVLAAGPGWLECGGHVKYLAVVTGARCDFIGHVLLSPASIFRLSFVIRLTLGLFLLSHHRLLGSAQPQTTNIWNWLKSLTIKPDARHVLQVHVSPVQRVTTARLLNMIRLPHLKRCGVTPVWVMRRWGLLWSVLSQSSRSSRTIWLASYGLFCRPAAASANSSSSENSKLCLCGWCMFVRASNEGSRRLREDFTITEKVPYDNCIGITISWLLTVFWRLLRIVS